MTGDLRDFIRAADRLGELKRVEGAHWDLELGAITELVAERKGPALLFDRIVGYPAGYRVLSNAFASPKRTALVLGIPPESSSLDMLKAWREKLTVLKLLPPVEVKDGPIMQNVLTGAELDIFRFPAPKWHELDGGRYLGTGCAVITKDPEEGWVNVGTYRCMLYEGEKNLIAVRPNREKHAWLMMEKYHAQGQPCPVAIAFGQDPALFLAATYNGVPWGVSEYDFASGLKEEPIEVVRGAITGLPIPANAELVIEGEIPPLTTSDPHREGPFGEWLGYYADVVETSSPVMTIKSILHRDDPIILGAPFLKPPAHSCFALPLAAATIWDEMEKAGVAGVTGVWIPIFDYAFMVVVSIKQMYPGHAKQAALAVAGSRGAMSGARFIIVVDDDINITNFEEVFWAVATRCDPDTIDIVKGLIVSTSYPLLTESERELGGNVKSRVIIDACRPYSRIKDFPPVNKFSSEYRGNVIRKWRDLLAKS